MKPKNVQVSARNQRVEELTSDLKLLEPKVLKLTGAPSIESLNGRFGGKHTEYVDTKNTVINSSEEFYSLYLQGFVRYLKDLPPSQLKNSAHYQNFMHVYEHETVRTWLKLFLERTYLRNSKSLSRVRPTVAEAEWWIGQNNASYGLFITPRFANGAWENDKSEIRHFKPDYWTIGHILETGLVIPDEEQRIDFSSVEQYLTFFKQTLVRASNSPHEMEIARRYCDYVRNHSQADSVPLLIPELRYNGKERKHKYRLDFTIITPETHSKVGFELSPWSTHGRLTGTKGKMQKEINQEAQSNFRREVQKQTDYFLKKGITVLIYTDEELKDYDKIFAQISDYLTPTLRRQKLLVQAKKDFMSYGKELTEQV